MCLTICVTDEVIRVLSVMCGIMRGTLRNSMLGMMLHGIWERNGSSPAVSQRHEACGVKEKRVQVLGVYSTV